MPSEVHVLLISGGCLTPRHFQALATLLSSHGYTVSNPRLASNSILPPANSFQIDRDLVRDIVKEKTDAGKEIIVVMHSYGGLVGTDAMTGMGVKERKARGQSGGVKWLAYMAALMPVIGERIIDIRKLEEGFVEDHTHTHSFVTDLVLFPKNPAPGFYHDLTDQEQKMWTEELTGFSHDAQRKNCQYEAWREIDVAYLLCEQDRAVPPEVQKTMIDRVRGFGIDVQETRCNSSHCPFLSQPETVVAWINKLR
ncbi:hypothetical protein Z517_06831 [Fonsecaea pedrosoi CBS 271.37]|uniref:AB hydrolase-1 domain-containing protein n=1 Tax=Fonsecaea pedrosoi CBS 271.37 TaxID=1442368 RepID=A0A0D2DQW0_9EURO|nr:uncharacterized protein Z517_06831 [Fonsecaea pedrosoi CBS 271.37]KIW80216.1 hypothetical protein Z517_06831 [Fonsecaea pedrosoi CBS 271.37]